MLIGELADIAGVTCQTVRFYERRGLLPDAERGANGYRVYDEAMLARLRFINVAQAAGLTLSEIRTIIALRDDGHLPCAHVVTLIDTKLADVRARIKQLAALQTELKHSATTVSCSIPPTAKTTTSATYSPQRSKPSTGTKHRRGSPAKPNARYGRSRHPPFGIKHVRAVTTVDLDVPTWAVE